MLTYRTDYDKIMSIISRFIKKFSDGKPVAIGISGGVDSALCGALAKEAIGKENIHVLLMPSRYTPKEDVTDALKFAKEIAHKVIYVSKSKLEKLRKDYDKSISTTGENENIVMDAYIRNNLLRRYSRKSGCRLLGTINGTEWQLGYYPKYSLVGDLLPIADLYKSQVFELAEHIGVPREICGKVPTLSLGCAPIVADEKLSHIDKELIRSKLSYKELDKIMIGLNKHFSAKEIVQHGKRKITLKQVKIVHDILMNYKHKTKLPPFPKINVH